MSRAFDIIFVFCTVFRKGSGLLSSLSMTTILMFVGIGVLAIALIVVAIWVGRVSRRMNSVVKALHIEQRRVEEVERYLETQSNQMLQQAQLAAQAQALAKQKAASEEGRAERASRRQSRARREAAGPRANSGNAKATTRTAAPVSVPALSEELAVEYAAASSALQQQQLLHASRQAEALAEEEFDELFNAPEESAMGDRAEVQANWIKAEERRYAERMTRQQRSRTRREERQQAHLRKQAEAIVQKHIDQVGQAIGQTAGQPTEFSNPIGYNAQDAPLGYRRT